MVRSRKAIADTLHAEKHPFSSSPCEPMTPLSERPIFEFIYAVVERREIKLPKRKVVDVEFQNLRILRSLTPSEAIEPLTPRQAMYSSDGDNRMVILAFQSSCTMIMGTGKDTRVVPMAKVQNQHNLNKTKKRCSS